MTDQVTFCDTMNPIWFAQRVATHAVSLGAMNAPRYRRPCITHLGAMMADAILQPGLNYRTVVCPRIERIIKKFPETSTLIGVYEIIESDRLSDFLSWTHSEKLVRFCKLASYFDEKKVDTVESLCRQIGSKYFRAGLLNIRGIGPKTVDYISCLSGIDTIAVDRHIIKFAHESGVDLYDYEDLRTIFSYAADLLDIPRRNFDSWIWSTVSSRSISKA